MKLTRLRLVGFKSFVEPTDFHIEPGLTGVVGPNGCGKSNLIEALRWVMGEASHKSMRAASMDDVIFSGSAHRPARNNAEVVLSLDNSDRTAPAALNEFDALEISRRIERDSGSTYRVNGREVRARDVQILFADASTGARSPALVHQGKVGEIINAKPEQRRRVLEEAAGISGLHARRHEAELRLRAAETNLERLEDVVAQLSGQIDGLKRQARQAIRYRALAGSIRQAEATLYHLRWQAAQLAVRTGVEARDAAVRLVAERTGAQAQAARDQAVAAAALPDLRDAESRAAAALQHLRHTSDGLEREETRARERLAQLERQLAQLAEDRAREERLATDAEAALERLAAEHKQLVSETEGSETRRAEVAERVAAAEAALAEADHRFSDLTRALADLTAQRTQIERQRNELSQRLQRLLGQMAEVGAERASLEQPIDREAPALAELAEAVEAAQRAVADAEAAAMQSEAEHAAARQAHEAARAPLAAAERRAQTLETEARTLAKVLNVETKNLWPPVLDLLTVQKGYETALGAALGDDLDAPIDPKAPVRWAGADAGEADPALPEGVAPLANFVQAPPELARRLAQIGMVEREQGAQLAPQLKTGQRLVSREGDLWRWDGYAAAAHAVTSAARRLAERNRLADIQADLVQAQALAVQERTNLEQAAAALRARAQAEGEARTLWRTRQRELDAARERHSAAEREANRHAARLSALAEAGARLATSIEEASHAHGEAEAAFVALPQTASIEADLAGARMAVADRRANLAEARAEHQALAREAELARRRIEAISSERKQWQSRRDGAGAQIAALEQRSEAAAAERAALEEQPDELARRRRTLISELEEAEKRRREAADMLAAAEASLAEADKAARSALDAMAQARESAAREEERLGAAERRLEEIAHEIKEMLEVEPEGAARLAGIAPGASLPDVGKIEEDLERMRRDRERLGAVNLRAEEELREVEAQHDKLTGERDDLVEAIKRLRQGIQSLNREARERLTSSFETVNGHFQKLFTSLFGGGTAELQLIESDDPLEAGLDILAKPPGKKPQTLSLLSGGEQALTALALIFAVFLTNPSPICVLDEVDAPLDDHNVERFCGLLDEMTKLTDTRFVIITHNPITMARMNRLYGVTMAERGVSQLVSVDLDAASQMREAS